MTILQKPIDYTDRDFDSIRARLFDLISSVFPTWTETKVANFGNVLIESFAFVIDILLKYQDNQSGESRWTTATQRKNLLALTKLIDYTPPGATASTVDVTISIPEVRAFDVDIPADTVVRTNDVDNAVEFRTLLPVTITAGLTEVTVSAENSEPADDSFSVSGKANTSVELTSSPYLDDSAVVTAGNGVYTEVDNFLLSDATDLHYTVTVDQNDVATLKFGNGVNGAPPTGTLSVVYRTGGGSSGSEVEAGTITVVEGNFTDTSGASVNLSVTNDLPSSLAVDRASREEIRQNAPLSLRSLNRTISRDDYEFNAVRVTGIARALALTAGIDSSVPENNIYIYPVPESGGLPSQALKDAILTEVTVTRPNPPNVTVTVLDPVYATLNITTRVHFSAGTSPTVAAAAIRSNLEDFFAIRDESGSLNPNVGYGYEFIEETGASSGLYPWSDVYNVIRDTSGVRKVADTDDRLLINGSDEDPVIALREFVQLGTVTIIDAATGSEV